MGMFFRSFYFMLSLLVFISHDLKSQCVLKGQITDQNDEPVPYVSVYIPALNSGGMANINGEYQIKIPCRNFEVEFQSLGFQKQTIAVAQSGTKTLDVKLKPKIYKLQEITVGTDQEDPAYAIIRKAMVMSEYYKEQVKAYECDVYVRSFYDVKDIPALVEKLASDEDLRDIKVGNIYEAILHYTYEKPGYSKELIKHQKSGDLDTSKTGSSYINLSFYNLGGPEMINPLSRNAFAVYDFEFISSYLEDGNIVNKIKINPKRKGNDLMSGMIYINDRTWSLNSVDVRFKQQAIDIHYKQTYNQIEPNVWLPINHDIRVKTKLIGFEVDFQYLASLSNVEIKTDEVLDLKIKDALGKDEYLTKEVNQTVKDSIQQIALSKTEEKISSLITKESLTKKETFQLMRLIKKQEREESEKAPAEIDYDYNVIYDDSAFAQSTNWDSLRTIPLSLEESNIYVSRDSVNLIIDGDTIITDERRFIANLFVYNGLIKMPKKNQQLRVPGLFRRLSLQFNTVDGLAINKTLFNYKHLYSQGKYIEFEPSIGIITARKGMNKLLKFKSIYNYKKRSGFNMQVGKVTADFNGDNAILPTTNTIASLLFEENYAKLYQKEFINIEYQSDISDGWQWLSAVEYSHRTPQDNNSDFKIFNYKSKRYSENLIDHPVIPNPRNILTNNSFTFSSELTYTPNQRYYFRKHEKYFVKSNKPTYGIEYEQSFKDVLGGENQFIRTALSVKQSRAIGLINEVSYQIAAGAFLQKGELPFYDFQSFATTPFFISRGDKKYTYRLLPYTSFNSNDYYLSGHLSVVDNVLLLKRLPFLNQTNLTEAFHFNYLLTEQDIHYTEVGYGLNRIFWLIDVELFSSFLNAEYEDFGFRMSIKF